MIGVARQRKRALGTLGERLLQEGLVTESDIVRALDRQRETGEFLGETLVSLGIASLRAIRPHLEAITGFPVVDIAEEDIDPAVCVLIPESFAVAKRALPFRQEDSRVFVAMADPLNVATIDDLKAQVGRSIVPCLALSNDLREAIKRAFDSKAKAQTLLDEMSFGDAFESVDSLESVLEQSDDAPIVRLVNSIMSGAFAAGASDIHIEPQESRVRVRYRIDGILYDQMTMPSSHLPAVTSRLKVIAGLDIAERRRPQDGRFSSRDEHGQEFDIRLSVMPTVHGEKACMRLLEKASTLPEVEDLGFLPDQVEAFSRMIKKPHGLILVTGPTGSGKTTTLYAGLQRISTSSLNINTVEDPVEYRLPGANQVQVNPKIGLTFATGLRMLVRQDPDVILIGEIRDKETAEIAIQAALTGHLVLSTLHTNDAPSALIRLQNMGIEPYLISSAVVGVLGQRLLRKVCPQCKETYDPETDLKQAMGMPVHSNALFARGAGCRRCGGRGMKGRVSTCEIMPMRDEIRKLLLAGASGADLMSGAVSLGMRTMREAAMQRVLDHTTTPEEVLRVFAQDD